MKTNAESGMRSAEDGAEVQSPKVQGPKLGELNCCKHSFGSTSYQLGVHVPRLPKIALAHVRRDLEALERIRQQKSDVARATASHFRAAKWVRSFFQLSARTIDRKELRRLAMSLGYTPMFWPSTAQREIRPTE
jgi:hypothetical protein